jgi:signal transduction histidine kinase
MAVTIQDMRALARKSTEGQTIFDPIPGLQSVLRVSEREFQKHGIALQVVLPKAAGTLYGKSSGLEQVLLNLLSNARDAAPKVGGRVEVSCQWEESHLVILVRDNGPGVPPESLSRIFEPYFTTKPVGQGTGLGLSICFGILESMAGTIHVRNLPEGGAEFTVRVPKDFRVLQDTPIGKKDRKGA